MSKYFDIQYAYVAINLLPEMCHFFDDISLANKNPD